MSISTNFITLTKFSTVLYARLVGHFEVRVISKGNFHYLNKHKYHVKILLCILVRIKIIQDSFVLLSIRKISSSKMKRRYTEASVKQPVDSVTRVQTRRMTR